MTATYPSTEELERIAKWPHGDYTALMNSIQPYFADYGRMYHMNGEWTLVTGGWSGCEEIISALQENHLFWSICWQSSVRGGLFTFKVP